jgi:hypothetical protein
MVGQEVDLRVWGTGAHLDSRSEGVLARQPSNNDETIAADLQRA